MLQGENVMRMSKIALLTVLFALLIPVLAKAIPPCEYICASPYPEDQEYCQLYCEQDVPAPAVEMSTALSR